MGRLSTGKRNYLAGNSHITVTMLQIDVNGSSSLRYTDAPFDLTFNSSTWQAQGVFLGISESQEVSDLQITSVSISLSALDLTTVQTLGNSDQINQEVVIWKAYLDPTTNQIFKDSALEDDGVLIFRGTITGYSISNDKNTASLILDVSSQFSNFERTGGRRTNIGNWHREHPLDYGMEYSHESLKDIKWGRK
ncbi:putative baseplate hub protein [Phage DSL-LC06]|nr:putative baseplate hub protein [Phage DSL-LC06]